MDYLDPDDHPTPFTWLAEERVVGAEPLPRSDRGRGLVSPLELINVSAFRPAGPGRPRGTDPGILWFDPARRLYRVFEFLTCAGPPSEPHARVRAVTVPRDQPATGATEYVVTPDGVAGVTPGGADLEDVVVTAADPTSFTAPFHRRPQPGAPVRVLDVGDRVAGRVNLNTVWDADVLLALCDPQSSDGFTADDVRAVFRQMLAARTPRGVPAGPGVDRPFLSLATGWSAGDAQYPSGIGIEDTLLRPDSADPTRRLFEPAGAAGAPPHRKAELLTKLFNQVTVRSNVFAVWVTVGFFEVTDDAARPVRMGAEIGRSESRHVRRRFLAVVDRSRLAARPARPPGTRFDPHADAALVPFFSVIE